jgi:alpha-beta hydrolase superfamily lysophospholipase
LPRDVPRAHLIGLHGIQSHSGWYDYSCRRLCEAGYGVYFLDRRGSGLNTADRGDTPGFRRLLLDVREFVQEVATSELPIPIVVLAISWGGKIGTALCRRYPGLIDGLALLCPGIRPKVGPSAGERWRIFWTRLVSPKRRFPIPLNDPALFTATPKWREFIAQDPLALREATARFLVESVRLDLYLRFVPAQVRVPVLLLLAQRDQIIDNRRTRAFVQRFATNDKEVIEYAGAHHTLEFEPNPDVFIDDLINWLRARERLLVKRREEVLAIALEARQALNPGAA